MNNYMKLNLEKLVKRYINIEVLLNKDDVINDHNKFCFLSKEYSKLEPIVKAFKAYKLAKNDFQYANDCLESKDCSNIMQNFMQLELTEAESKIKKYGDKLFLLLLPKDQNDKYNVFLEIRAGSGGNEASIFAGDLFRMYIRYAEKKKWKTSILNYHANEQGGYKEIIVKISGKEVYSNLKFESGTHRVQRVPMTESQGRIHTSTCTIAVMPESEKIREITINNSDLKIDSFRASGAGGQHVNKTDSAVRITHLPSNIVVECQEGRSQHKNRAQAISILKSKLLQLKIDSQRQVTSDRRKNLVGSGDRSERIRTYNFSQSRVTDHRINLTLYKLEEIIAGNLALIIQPLILENQANLLTNATLYND